MWSLHDILPADMLALLDQGGVILWLIMSLSLVLWLLIAERYIYLWFVYPKQLSANACHRELRSMDSLSNNLNRFLLFIGALVQVLPLLGLLGTVRGMIEIFDVMAAFGNANTQGIAEGISVALVTTMAGLLMALSGLYFDSNLRTRIASATEILNMKTKGYIHEP